MIVRLLANLKEIEEPFEKDQIGRSAFSLREEPIIDLDQFCYGIQGQLFHSTLPR
jgi:hypothetical protein